MSVFEEMRFAEVTLLRWLVPTICLVSVVSIVHTGAGTNFTFFVLLEAFYGSIAAISIIWPNRIRKRILTAAAVRRLMQ